MFELAYPFPNPNPKLMNIYKFEIFFFAGNLKSESESNKKIKKTIAVHVLISMLRQAYHFKAILIWQNGPFNCMNILQNNHSFRLTEILIRKVLDNKQAVLNNKSDCKNLLFFFK
jgi:hypothetical protein